MYNKEITIQVVDNIGAQKQILELVVPTLKLTMRELIWLRVHQEFFSAKIADEDASQRVKEIRKDLNGRSDKQFIWMDSIENIDSDSTWEIEAEKACQNFEKGKFFIIAAGKQVNKLDEEIILRPEYEVQFNKLIPLIGG